MMGEGLKKSTQTNRQSSAVKSVGEGANAALAGGWRSCDRHRSDLEGDLAGDLERSSRLLSKL